MPLSLCPHTRFDRSRPSHPCVPRRSPHSLSPSSSPARPAAAQHPPAPGLRPLCGHLHALRPPRDDRPGRPGALCAPAGGHLLRRQRGVWLAHGRVAVRCPGACVCVGGGLRCWCVLASLVERPFTAPSFTLPLTIPTTTTPPSLSRLSLPSPLSLSPLSPSPPAPASWPSRCPTRAARGTTPSSTSRAGRTPPWAGRARTSTRRLWWATPWATPSRTPGQGLAQHNTYIICLCSVPTAPPVSQRNSPH